MNRASIVRAHTLERHVCVLNGAKKWIDQLPTKRHGDSMSIEVVEDVREMKNTQQFGFKQLDCWWKCFWLKAKPQLGKLAVIGNKTLLLAKVME